MSQIIKRFYSFITVLIITCLVGLAPMHAYCEARYALYIDVPSDHWAWDSIRYASRKQWVNGYSDGSFKPDNNITRAEVMKILVVALNRVLVALPSGLYDDVSSDDWFAKYVVSGSDLFLPDGNNFRPQDNMTREEAVYALVRAFKLNQKIQYADTSLLNKFDDSDKLSAHMKQHMIIALQTSLVSGYNDDTLRPDNSLSRAEFATLLYRAILISNDKY